jgi:hypothetical protein
VLSVRRVSHRTASMEDVAHVILQGDLIAMLPDSSPRHPTEFCWADNGSRKRAARFHRTCSILVGQGWILRLALMPFSQPPPVPVRHDKVKSTTVTHYDRPRLNSADDVTNAMPIYCNEHEHPIARSHSFENETERVRRATMTFAIVIGCFA